MKNNMIIIPALYTNNGPYSFITRNWQAKYGFTVHIINAWSTEADFSLMIKKIIDAIDELSKNGDSVSLIGTSGGGSLAINAFIERKTKVNKVINVCGRLRVGVKNDLKDSKNDKQLKAYIESIAALESKEKLLSKDDRGRIMTVSPKFGQEFVPKGTVEFDGAKNITIPTAEHIFSILAALSLFSKPLIEFLGSF